MTLNNALDKIRVIGEGHKMINAYYEGDVLEYTSSSSARESAFVATLTGATVVRTQTTLKLTLYFFDWCEKNPDKEREIWSDQLLNLLDVLAELRDPANDWDINDSSQVSFFTERYEDSVSGVQTDITITFDYEADRCAVPKI